MKTITHAEIVEVLQDQADEFECLSKSKEIVKSMRPAHAHVAAIYREAIRRLESVALAWEVQEAQRAIGKKFNAAVNDLKRKAKRARARRKT